MAKKILWEIMLLYIRYTIKAEYIYIYSLLKLNIYVKIF